MNFCECWLEMYEEVRKRPNYVDFLLRSKIAS